MNSTDSPQPRADIGDQSQHLRLDRDVERRNRLVRDEYIRIERECPRQSDALPLAAGEFVGKAIGGLRIQPDQLEQLQRPRGSPWPRPGRG